MGGQLSVGLYAAQGFEVGRYELVSHTASGLVELLKVRFLNDPKHTVAMTFTGICILQEKATEAFF